MIGIGLGLSFIKGGLIDSQAQAHFNRVVADGGTIPAGLAGCDAWFKAVKGVYGVSDITSAISSGIDPHYLGYKLGAGSGSTLGSAAQKLYSCCGSTGDLIQTTAASQPLILPHTGTNYVWLPGVASNVFTSNSQSSFNFGGDFSMVFDVKPLTSPNIEVSGCLNSLFYSFAIVSPGVLRFSGGGATISSTSSINTSIRQWIRISRSGNNWLFYTSTDGITWTQLGTTVVNAVSLSSASINIRVGDGGGAIGTPYSGIIYRGLFYMDSTATTIVRDFNPASYSASTSQTQWTSTTGEVWTINTGTATTGYKGILVDRTIMQGDGIDDRLISTITLLDGHTNYCSFRATSQDGSGNRAIYGNGTTSFNNTLASLSTNLIFTSLTSALFGGTVANTLNTLSMATTQWATNNTKTKINNGTFGSTISGAYVGGAGYNLFSTAGAHFGNPFISTNIISSSVDNSTIQTAMYNLIRGINNNAF